MPQNPSSWLTVFLITFLSMALVIVFQFYDLINFTRFEGMQGSGYAVGIAIRSWEWLLFIAGCAIFSTAIINFIGRMH